jgi:2-polyprenyl-6-methoxyphenol hydroxylase-like FAD-dependent oxidoreductase
VVGARCAGAPLAMLLAHRGHRVLLVDRATFPSDTISTHVVHPPGAAALGRWGLLDRLTATGCPPIHTYTFDFGPVTIAGTPGTEAYPVAYCPRRTILDTLLLDAAREAGVEVREAFVVDDILFDGGRAAGIKGHDREGRSVTEHATVVAGADGRQSKVAPAVGATHYNEKPPLLAIYYSYWSGLPMEGRFETYSRERRGFAAAPTNDGLTMLVGGWPHAEFEANKRDVERHFLDMIELAPGFAGRLRFANRETPFYGAAVPNYFRKPYGAGWVLVGDAGYNKDPVTAQGITDAFLDAERTADALDRALTGVEPFELAMERCHRARDEHALPMYDFTCQIAAMEPPPPEFTALLAATAGSQAAMDDFVRMNAGTISPAQFFAPDHVAKIMAGAQPSHAQEVRAARMPAPYQRTVAREER